jgi:hypothetical protein
MFFGGSVAQWLEQTAHNRLVLGSSPSGPTIASFVNVGHFFYRRDDYFTCIRAPRNVPVTCEQARSAKPRAVLSEIITTISFGVSVPGGSTERLLLFAFGLIAFVLGLTRMIYK